MPPSTRSLVRSLSQLLLLLHELMSGMRDVHNEHRHNFFRPVGVRAYMRARMQREGGGKRRKRNDALCRVELIGVSAREETSCE